jgi:hypothetical protein
LAVFQLLEYAGRLTVLIAVVFYFVEAPEQRKQAHYEAWQLINSAQGQTGSGGRIEALQDLNNDHISLAGIAAPKAYLANISLPNADLTGADLTGADLTGAYLLGTNLTGVQGLTIEQINTTDYWQQAIYDDDFRVQLGLPPLPDEGTLP